MSILKVSVNNWEKYNPRTDRKNYSWFRFQNDFLTDPLIFNLSCNAKCLLIHIFCEASKKSEGRCDINLHMASSMLGITLDEASECMQVIVNSGLATIDNHPQPKDGNCQPKDGLRTNERTNETNVKRQAATSDFDFDIIYDAYPRKEGKSAGLKKCKTIIKSQKKFDEVLKSVENYAASVKFTEPKYIKHFSSFLSNWIDYLDFVPSTVSETANEHRILACLSAGITKLDDLHGREDLKLSEADKTFISNNGGLSNLGRMSEYAFKSLFKT